MAITEVSFFEVKREVEKSPYTKANLTKPKRISLPYLIYRLQRPFFKLKYKHYKKSNPTHPWLTPDGIKALQKLLTKDLKGLEYGSGRSTVFFSKLLKHVTSIEHNELWYNQVTELLLKEAIDNVNLKLVNPNSPQPMPRLSSEEDVLTTAANYPVKDSCFQAYVDVLDDFQDESFDFILIDGRARVSCSFKAIPKLKSGGLFVLDNSERIRYKKIHERLSTWPSIYTTTGLTDTVIWRKP